MTAAECYYMDGDGDMASATSVGGYYVNSDGCWVQDGYVKRRLCCPHACYPDAVDYTTLTSTEARTRSWPVKFAGTGIEYQGAIYDFNSTGYRRCFEIDCYNPSLKGGYYCEYHSCIEAGCKKAISYSDYNCGFCPQHLEAHNIDDYHMLLADGGSVGKKHTLAPASKSGSSSSSKNSGSVGSSRTEEKKTDSSSKNNKSLQDSYDEGYDDVYYNEDYDDDRYRTDEDYARGVDDAMDDEGWDW